MGRGIKMLKLKKRGNEALKILYYGLDGSGKSTAAHEKCQELGLKPACIDVDDTNFTGVDIIDLDLSNDIKAYKNIKEAIKEIAKAPDYDTIVLDGVSALLELLTPHVEGQRAYKVRADRWSSILQQLINTKKNLIFIGQADMEVIFNDDYQSPKPIIKVNSIVNEKYKCIKEGNNFNTKLEKYRGSRDERPTPKSTPKPPAPSPKPPSPKVEPKKEEKGIPKENLEKACKNYPLIRVLIKSLKQDGVTLTEENIRNELNDDERVPAEMVTKIMEIING